MQFQYKIGISVKLAYPYFVALPLDADCLFPLKGLPRVLAFSVHSQLLLLETKLDCSTEFRFTKIFECKEQYHD